jgi:hypothetical protein
MNITIKNWSEYNPRKDIKHPTWFALPNRLLEDADLFSLEPIELKAMLYIFCQASQKNTDTISLNFQHADRVCQIKEKDLRRTLEKLSDLGRVQIRSDDVRERTESVRARDATDTTDRQDKQTQRPSAPRFDFESVYAAYPRKEGKAAGFSRLKKRITTQAEFDQFAKAVRRYASICKLSGKDLKYTMQFSTFVGTEGAERWLDYVESSLPNAPPVTFTPPPDDEPEAPLTPAQIEELKRKRDILAGKRG